METKISKVRAAMSSGDWQKAFSIASKFGRLGDGRDAILRAQSATINPGFYRQLNRDISGIIEDGKKAMVSRFGKA